MSRVPGVNFVLPIRVYYEDTDAAGVVYYASYLKFLERARTEWLRALGYEQRRLAGDFGVAFVARSISAEYLKPALLDDLLNVSSTIESVGRVQVVFGQNVLRESAQGVELLLTAKMRVACVDSARMKAAAMPEDVFQTFRILTSNRTGNRA
ncbi:acyl-CoA thioesterase YbgC [mine drainage metagenome]|uniref:Acyl-CoA thioesterase YbgC n=1 Tax=mine drainage metagenome TaxID=410659 RepID=A0A1J5RSS9_9ZZZZ